MTERLKVVGLITSMLVAPMTVSAATVRLDPSQSGSTFDLLADDYGFAEVFGQGTKGTTLTYSFENTSDRPAALTIVGGSVLQVGASFKDGISFVVGGKMFDYDEGVSDTFGTTLKVAASEIVNVVLSFGDVVNNASVPGRGSATATFTVEAAVVPVPAAGPLLLTAVGGLVVARRRQVGA